MLQLVVTIFLGLIAAYLIVGLLFTAVFLARGLQKIDEDVPGSSFGFRIIIIPGCVLLWPVLWRKWKKAVKIY